MLEFALVLAVLATLSLVGVSLVVRARRRCARVQPAAPSPRSHRAPTDGKIAERFVAQHCDATFLSLWGLSNPVGKDQGKELCDYLVVCDPDIILISVKDITLLDAVNDVDRKRWRRRAIKKSAEAIYGAVRVLSTLQKVNANSGRELKLPPIANRRIHRICVAFGGRREIPISVGNYGKGFVHVLDEITLPLFLRELDTISDFVNYLQAMESLIESGCGVVAPGEEELLALYLHNGRLFPSGHDRIILDDTLWNGLANDPQYVAAVEENKKSYAWDNVIEYITKDLLADDLLFSEPPGDEEIVLRTMARETRFDRRYLGESLTYVLTSGKVRARIIQSESGVVYVFAAFPRGEDREFRKAELMARCYLARSTFKDSACKVVGIASERADDAKPGLSFDIILIDIPEWTAELEARAEKAKPELGFFKNPNKSTQHYVEYPEKKN